MSYTEEYEPSSCHSTQPGLRRRYWARWRSGNTSIFTVPASEDEDVTEDVVEDRDEDEEMEDVLQILWDVIISLAELNK